MSKIITDPTVANDPVPVATLGGTYEYNGNLYKYVQFKDAVAYLAGHVVSWANATGTAVTNDRSGGSALAGTIPAGVACRVMTQNYYGFIQVTGLATLYGDGSIAAGDVVVLDTGTDGYCDTMASTEESLIVGTALADDGPTFLCALKGLV